MPMTFPPSLVDETKSADRFLNTPMVSAYANEFLDALTNFHTAGRFPSWKHRAIGEQLAYYESICAERGRWWRILSTAITVLQKTYW
ncbi:MAG: hypothetical protein H6603_05025 [Flavobacteriales bacterium]|nr:hypothetical protein [Flavobacteriales bacterium]